MTKQKGVNRNFPCYQKFHIAQRERVLGRYYNGSKDATRVTMVRAFGPNTIIKASNRTYVVDLSGAFRRTDRVH